MKIKAACLLMVLLIPILLGVFGCEMAPNTPIYTADTYEENILLSEVEGSRLSKPCSTEWHTTETIQLSREEYDVLYDFTYELIVALYCHSYTATDEAALTDAYQLMIPELSAAVSESQYFEKHILNIKENDIYVLMKYLSIANGGYVDMVRDASGREALILFKPDGVEAVNDVEKIPAKKRDAVLWLIEKHSLNNGEAVTIGDYETVKQIATEFVSTLYAIDYRTASNTSFDSLYSYMSGELESDVKQNSYFERYLTEIKDSSLSINILNQIKSETFDRGNAIVYKLDGEETFLFHCFCDIEVSYEQVPDDEFYFRQGNNKLTVAFLIRRVESEPEYEIIDWAYSLPLSEGIASE